MDGLWHPPAGHTRPRTWHRPTIVQLRVAKYGTMAGEGMDCPKHHVISRYTLDATKDRPSPGYVQGHKITPATGPAVRMPQAIHEGLPTSGSLATADAERLQEVANVMTSGIVDAFDAAARRDLEVLRGMVSVARISWAEYEGFVKAYAQARTALIEQLTKVHGSAPAYASLAIPDARDLVDVAKRSCGVDGGGPSPEEDGHYDGYFIAA